MNNKIIIGSLLVFSLFLSGCGKKTTTSTPPAQPTVVKMVEMPVESRPYVSLVPREDGHMLYLKLSSVNSNIKSIEYELIYTATDGTIQMEKGLGDTIKDISSTIERKLLLGTESCTNGCKYKFDEGVSGGTLTLKFFTKDGQASNFETTFSLKTGAMLNQEKSFQLPVDNITVPISTKLPAKDYFVLMKQYKGGHSIFSNNSNPIAKDY